MIPRLLTPALEEALNRQAAVALLGPRQVGKTTLALQVGQTRNALYLDLEDREDLTRLTNPELFFASFADRLIILDEIHRMPALFETLRGVIDRGRRTQQGTGRFLLLGSASLDLMQQTGESLAGRIAYCDLSPFSVLEVVTDFHTQERLWLRGGFPGSHLADSDRQSQEWRRDFIRTYLQRDVALFGPRIPATTLERLWTMLAHRQGSMLNSSELARSLEISTQSVTRYIDLLCDLMLVRRLAPCQTNIGKRLVKAPKLYLRDSGLVHALLGIGTLDQLAAHPIVGMSWEGFVLENLLTCLPWGAVPGFYRTSAGAEIDLIIEFVNGARWAIEIKRSMTARVTRGFHLACADLNPERTFVVHGNTGRYPLTAHQEAIGVRELAELLNNQ
ncbi:MAG: ATP-binding protein [Magnetococcales bacterium]|nr:ATP-binding protein [Magnetococcales bacterium]NGZ07158.1 ATP-binding protein [Magnetococcales bacterium]